MSSPHSVCAPKISQIKTAWASFLHKFPVNHEIFAVTLAFNNRIQGTVFHITQSGTGATGRKPQHSARENYHLGGYRHVPISEVTHCVNHAWLKTNRRLWSDRYARSGRPVSAYRGFVEKRTENVHVHLAWALPPVLRRSDFGDTLTMVWQGLVPSGSAHIEPLSDALGWGDYIIKKVFTRDWSDRSGRIPQPNDEAENFLSSPPLT